MSLIRQTFFFWGELIFKDKDFLLPDRHKASPVEVKSPGYETHASLDEFCRKFSGRILNKYIIYTKDYKEPLLNKVYVRFNA